MPLSVRRPSITANKTDLADLLALQVSGLRLPRGEREYYALTPRKFRCDLAWPNLKLFAEVNGGEYQQGRHSRAAGMAADYEKHALLTLAGWRGFWFTGGQVRNGWAIQILEQYFAQALQD